MPTTILENKFNVSITDNLISVATVGIQGVIGPAGADGPVGPAGMFNWLGTWSAGTSYVINDSVEYNGSSYVSLTSNIGSQPDITLTDWDLTASAGADGQPGPGVSIGGTVGQVLSKVDATDFNTQWLDLPFIPSTVNDLSDISNSAPVNGDILIYSGSPATYTNRLLIENDISDFGNYEPANTNIQTHIADNTKHRLINDAGNLTTELFSASKIISGLSAKSDVGHTHIKANIIDFNDADYATAIQGLLADSAVQPSDNISTLINDVGYLTSFTETDPVFLAQKGTANGVATLGADSKIPSSQMPAIAITETSVVANELAMLALTAQTGDVAVRTDVNESYILQGTDPSILSHWVKLLTPTDIVLSVNTQTGAVVLTTSDIAEGINLYYTESRVNANADVAAATLHIADNTIHFTQANISITKTQISDFVETDYATSAQGALADTAVQPLDNISVLTNDAGYLTSFTETNDLTAAVTWANVPDVNITETSVTQHEAALTITESQISDLGTYATKDLNINTQTGTAYTLVLADANTKVIEMNNAAANTLTVPPNSSVAFPVGTRIDIIQYGAGATTVAQGAGVTVRTAETLVLDGQYSGATLYKRATDEWVLIGRLVAV